MEKDKILVGIDKQNFETGLPEPGHDFLISSSPTLTDLWKSKVKRYYSFNE